MHVPESSCMGGWRPGGGGGQRMRIHSIYSILAWRENVDIRVIISNIQC